MKQEFRFHACPSRPPLPVCLAALAAVLLAISPLQAQLMVLPVNLTYLARRAAIIVQGRVAEVRYESLPGYSNIPTVEVTLNVENMVRGPEGGTYTFREILMGPQAKTGKQGYLVGQRLFLFLPAPSQYGLSSPIGIEQGRFRIARGPSGSETVANELAMRACSRTWSWTRARRAHSSPPSSCGWRQSSAARWRSMTSYLWSST